ncbi:MAG: hypothetical protein J6B30_06325 [Muribaculaceae bacterium]|nr:hypothetical protein [Muribaculaceae bacterium]
MKKVAKIFAQFENCAYLCNALGRKSWAIRIVLWCNGSTAVFGSACLGSSPGKTTKKDADSLSRRLFGLLQKKYIFVVG